MRPLLGTVVSIRVTTEASESFAHSAIDAAFDAVAHVHARISFHEPDSDLSRLHGAHAGTWVNVDPHTAIVLRTALDLSARSDGAFDATVGGDLVAHGLLPPPTLGDLPDGRADWHDLEVDRTLPRVRLRRPAWIDLGGIAKGYAVDLAIDCLRDHGMEQACVNAGGDLRWLGDGHHQVAIDTEEAAPSQCPVLELGEMALATSSGRSFAVDGRGPHLHGRTRDRIGLSECVSVVAPRCILADALTKIVLACGTDCAPLLCALDATAYLHAADGQWSTFGSSA